MNSNRMSDRTKRMINARFILDMSILIFAVTCAAAILAILFYKPNIYEVMFGPLFTGSVSLWCLRQVRALMGHLVHERDMR